MADLRGSTTVQSTTNSFHLSTLFHQLDDFHKNQIRSSRYLVISPHQYASIAKYIFILQCLISLGGMVGNALSIRTFLKIGLNDSVTITFFSLAISDFSCLVVIVLMAAYFLNDIAMIESHYVPATGTYSYYNTFLGLDPIAWYYCVAKVYDMVFFVSSSLITFLAVQRSLCVVLPLRFKGMFTRRKALIIISLISSYWIAIFIGEWCLVTFETVDHGYAPNATRITMKAYSDSPLGNRFNEYRSLVNYTILPSLFLVVVLGGFFILSRALMESVRFRQTATMAIPSPVSTQTSGNSGKVDELPDNVVGGESKQKTAGGISSSKESQAITQVAILSAFFLLSQLPAIAWNIAAAIVPDLFWGSVYLYLRELCKNSYIVMDAVNASLNFLVYYRFNTKFREVCFQRKD